MATVNKTGQFYSKASNGDLLKVYPNTKIANVDGLQTALNGKVDVVSGKGLSTNDYTTTEKNKLAGIAAGATANIGTVTQVKVGSTAYNPSSGVISLPAYPSDTNTHRPIQMNGTEILGNNTTALNLKAGSNVSLSNSSGTVTIAATDTTYSAATQSANGLMSSTDKTKLDGIATGANNYTHPTSSGNKHIPSGGSSGQILRWSADGTAAWGSDNNTWTAMVGATSSANGSVGYVNAVPPKDGYNTKYLRADGAWAVPPNTTYSAATQSANGLMSSTDKTKLDGIATGATANIGTVTQVKVGSTAYNPSSGVVSLPAYPTTLPASDVSSWAKASTKPSYTYSEVGAAASSHTHNYAGSSSAGGVATSAAKLSNTSKIGDTNKPVYFKADGTPAAISYTIDKSVPSNAVFTDTTYSAATTSAAGLMSAADKTKLDGIATGANNYSLPNATTSSKGGVIVGSNLSVSNGTISMSSANVASALGYTPANNDGVNQALNTRVQSQTYAYTTSATSKVRIYKTANRGVMLAIYGSQGGTGKQSTILVLDVQSGILSVRRLSMGGNSEVVDSVTVNDYSTYSEMVVTLTVANSSWPPVIIPLMRNDNVPQIEVL